MNPKCYCFEVYRQQDVSLFLRLLDTADAQLLGVVHLSRGMLSAGYAIHYAHTSEITMEVLT